MNLLGLANRARELVGKLSSAREITMPLAYLSLLQRVRRHEMLHLLAEGRSGRAGGCGLLAVALGVTRGSRRQGGRCSGPGITAVNAEIGAAAGLGSASQPTSSPMTFPDTENP